LLHVRAYHQLRERQGELLEEELERVKDQLLRADRLATLGTLVAGVGHELNNITAVFKSTVYFIRQQAAKGLPPEDGDLERLERVGEHLTLHGHHILEYGRPGPAYEQKMDLGEIIRGTVEMLQILGRIKHIEVKLDFPPEPIMITINRTRIEQVMVNLLSNAADAVAEIKPSDKRIGVRIMVQPDHKVLCEVEDNGCGIPPDRLEAIFEPYYTTKPPGKGTGLGLPGVRQIVHAYGGVLVAKSIVGEGSRFQFTLPLGMGCEEPASTLPSLKTL
jgi:signal transduction histidine kinase